MSPARFLQRLRRERATAILRCGDQKVAARAMAAAIAGGFRVVEFTLTIPGALELVADFARRPGVVVGAGTVLEVAQARAAVRGGAQFLVSPVVDEAIIHEASALGVTAIPGAHTPTELLRAHRAGASLCKLFPAPAGGPAWLRACLGPLPFLRVVPTHGVDAGNAGAWLEAGAFALGFTTALFDPAALAAGQTRGIAARARALREAVAR